MTISQKTRRKDKCHALVSMLDELADDRYDEHFVEIQKGRFKAIRPTTWRELQTEKFVKAAGLSEEPRYRLTQAGWLRATRERGDLGQEQTRTRAAQLARAVKAKVNRRSHRPAFLAPAELARSAQLPEGWVFNALATQLLSQMFPSKMMEVTYHPERYFSVSSTFGMERPHD